MSITFGNKSGNLSFVSNVGGGGSTTIIEQADLVVEVKVDDNDNVIETSHTFEEVMAAYNESRMIALVVKSAVFDVVLRLSAALGDNMYFTGETIVFGETDTYTTAVAYWSKTEGLNWLQADTIQMYELELSKRGLASKEYVSGAIAGIEIPEVDLSGYYTKEEVDNKIPEVNLGDYALKTEIPDTSAFKTEEEIIALIEEHASGEPLPSAEEVEF